MLDSLLAGVMLFSSFAVRTPNTQPNPDDYEVSIGFSNDHYYVNRQWERELGEKYIDDLFWAKFDNGVYFKPEYMDKQSQDVKYLKLDWRRSHKGFTAGFTTRSITDKLDDYEIESTIKDITKDLDENQKKLIKMSFFEQKSHKNIAAELEIPLGTVKSRIRASLNKMQKHII